MFDVRECHQTLFLRVIIFSAFGCHTFALSLWLTPMGRVRRGAVLCQVTGDVCSLVSSRDVAAQDRCPGWDVPLLHGLKEGINLRPCLSF